MDGVVGATSRTDRTVCVDAFPDADRITWICHIYRTALIVMIWRRT